MAKQPSILAFAGSTREHSYSKRVVKIAKRGAENAGGNVTFVDLRDYPMPIYDQDLEEKDGIGEHALAFQKLLDEHDGYLIASPEYNASLPGVLKNAIDWASRKSEKYEQGAVFRGKVAAIMTESPGAFGGIRCLGHLRGVLSVLLVNVLPSEIAVGGVSVTLHTADAVNPAGVSKMFDGNGVEMTDEKMKKALEDLGASLVDLLRKTHGEIETVAEPEN